MTNQLNLNPLALIAALLFNLDQTRKLKIKPDNTAIPVEVEQPMIQLAKKEGALLCKFPLEKLVHFQHFPHNVQIKIEDGDVILFIERIDNSSGLVNANGQKIISDAKTEKELLHTLQ